METSSIFLSDSWASPPVSHLASPAQPRGTWAKPGTDENDDSDLDERPTRRAPGTGVD